MAYIYLIANDINHKKYVGKTERNLDIRFKEHCEDAFKVHNENRPLYRAIRKYGIEHFYISLIEETDTPNEREIYWIQYYQSYGNLGYNATLGGDGQKYVDDNEVIKTYSRLKNITHTAEALQICRDTVREILKTHNITPLTAGEIAKKQHSKTILQCNTIGEVLQKYNSYSEAATDMLNQGLTKCNSKTGATHISEVCRGKRKTFAGFIWKLI